MSEYKFKYFRYPTKTVVVKPKKTVVSPEVKPTVEEVVEEVKVEEPVKVEEIVQEPVEEVKEEAIVEEAVEAKETSLEEAGFSANSVKNLAVNGIETVEQLQAYIAEGKDLVDLEKIGKKAAAIITQELEDYLAK